MSKPNRMTEKQFFDMLEHIKGWGWQISPHSAHIRARATSCGDKEVCPITAVLLATTMQEPLSTASYNEGGRRLGLTPKLISSIVGAADTRPDNKADRRFRNRMLRVLGLVDNQLAGKPTL